MLYPEAGRALAHVRIKAARAEPWHVWPLLLAGLVAWLVSRSLVASPQLRVDVGAWGDHTYLSGVNAIEISSTEAYRWTTGRAELTLPNLSDQYQLLRLRAHGWRPAGQPAPEVRLDLMGKPWGSFQTTPSLRVYKILIGPSATSPLIRVGFESQVYTPPDDPRQIGFALDWLELRALSRPAAPNLWHLGSQALLLAVLALLLAALALPAGWALALGAIFVGALVWANVEQPLWVSQAIVAWLIVAALLLLATWLLAPRLRRLLEPWMSARQAGVAWALFIAALGLRLAGSVHPLFNAHDIDVHTRWLEIVNGGQLYLYSTPGEFRGQMTFNPPAGYILLMPLSLLLPSSRLVVQVGVALLDAIGCLAVLALAYELRLSARAALLAMGLYLALPINTTMLWWGFATNAMAQSLWLLLLWSLLRLIRYPTAAGLAIFAVLSAVCILTHIGALTLTLALLGLCLLLGWRHMSRPSRNAALIGLGLALLFVTPVYFAAVAGPVLGQFQSSDAPTSNLGATLAKNWVQRDVKLGLVSRGLLLGFLPPLLWLAPLGLARLWAGRAGRPLQRQLIFAWILVCLTFLLSYLSLSLLTRYIYFAVPLVCLAVGALLAELWRVAAGRIVAVAVALFVAWAGVVIWAEGVLMRVKPSVVALTH
jgi:toxin CptA